MKMYAEIAKMIDHSLLHPTLTDKELKEGCLVSRKYHVGSACVKPYHVKEAAKILKGSDVPVCAVIGFPHGNSTIEIKVAETRQVIKDGATEVDMVVNLGKVVGKDWKYVEKEVKAIAAVCRKGKALLKVIFENDLLPSDEFKIKLCRICSKAKVGYVKTSTGYNYVPTEDGKYTYKGATDDDLKLMRKYSDPKVGVKAAGGVRTVDAIMRVRGYGVTRIGTKGTERIVAEAKARFGEAEADAACCCECSTAKKPAKAQRTSGEY